MKRTATLATVWALSLALVGAGGAVAGQQITGRSVKDGTITRTATDNCLTAGRLQATVNARNELEASIEGSTRADRTITIRVRVDTFRGSALEYHDETSAKAEVDDPWAAASLEQLPLSWKRTHLRIRYTATAPCGSVTRWASIMTPRTVAA